MVAAALVMHRTGSKVYTNGMGLSFEAGSFTNFKSLMKIIDEAVNDPRPRIVCIDEAPLWVNAKKWAEFPTGLLSRLQQVRKYNVLVYYTCINELGVANELRRVTFWAWHCTRHGNRIIQKLMAPIEQQQPGAKPLLIKRLPMRQEMFAAYNTLGRLNTPDTSSCQTRTRTSPTQSPTTTGSRTTHGNRASHRNMVRRDARRRHGLPRHDHRRPVAQTMSWPEVFATNPLMLAFMLATLLLILDPCFRI